MAHKGTGHDRRLKWGDGWITERTTATGETRFLARWRESDPVTAKRVVRSRTFPTQAAAEAHLRDVADRQARGAYVPPERLTVAQVLDAFLARGASRWAPGTLGVYRARTKALILPTLGSLPIRSLTAPRVQHWLDGLVRRGLAPETIVGARRVLFGACKEAVVLGIVAANPVDGTRGPAIKPPGGRVWNSDEVRRVLVAVAGDPLLNAAYRVALSTGVRPGELLALRWSDVDLERGVLTVRRSMTVDADRREVVGETTKGKRPRRIALSPSTVAALREWRRAQVEIRLAAPAWADPDLVITDAKGRWLRREAWAAIHDGVIARAGVPDLVPHAMRHSYATLELEAGTHPRVVQERLGHRSITMTLDRYSHVSLDLQRAASEALESAVFGGDDATTPGRETGGAG